MQFIDNIKQYFRYIHWLRQCRNLYWFRTESVPLFKHSGLGYPLEMQAQLFYLVAADFNGCRHYVPDTDSNMFLLGILMMNAIYSVYPTFHRRHSVLEQMQALGLDSNSLPLRQCFLIMVAGLYILNNFHTHNDRQVGLLGKEILDTLARLHARELLTPVQRDAVNDVMHRLNREQRSFIDYRITDLEYQRMNDTLNDSIRAMVDREPMEQAVVQVKSKFIYRVWRSRGMH